MQNQTDPTASNSQDIYDLTGRTFGSVTVLKLVHIVKGRRFWRVRCTCGTEDVAPAFLFRTREWYCKECELIKLREAGLASPKWLQDLGFDESFLVRFNEKIDKTCTVHPIHGPCHIWTAGTNNSGYGCLSAFRDKGKSTLIAAHRAAWIVHTQKPIPEGMCVLHKCDTPRCVNAAEHLYLGTQKHNAEDREGRGRGNHPSGGKHPCSILTEKDVRYIREMYATGGVTYVDLAAMFHVSKSTIAMINRRKLWKHLA